MRVDVLGFGSASRTVRKPPKAMSSGSGLGSWVRTPTSVLVSSWADLYIVSVHAVDLGGELQNAVS